VLLGRLIHVTDTANGPRAIAKGKSNGPRAIAEEKLVKPESVERYLNGKFGELLDAVRTELEWLATRVPPEQLNREAFHLYEPFRPEVPPDERG
jgi:hypothetical protein